MATLVTGSLSVQTTFKWNVLRAKCLTHYTSSKLGQNNYPYTMTTLTSVIRNERSFGGTHPQPSKEVGENTLYLPTSFWSAEHTKTLSSAHEVTFRSQTCDILILKWLPRSLIAVKDAVKATAKQAEAEEGRQGMQVHAEFNLFPSWSERYRFASTRLRMLQSLHSQIELYHRQIQNHSIIKTAADVQHI